MHGYKPLEWAQLIARHMKDAYGWIVKPEELQQQLRNHDFWGAYMDALAYYGMKRTRFSLEQVPDEWKDGHIVNIRGKGVLTQYVWRGEWQECGAVYDELYKLGE